MSYNPNNPNGQTTVANSSPVVIASNQTAYPINLADPNNFTKAAISITGALSTQSGATLVFNDPFNGTIIDVTNRWNAPVLAGTGTVTQNGGTGMVFTVGTTANNSAQISTQPVFEMSGSYNYIEGIGVQLEASPIATGNHRFWGWGIAGTAYSTTNPVQNGIGFEVTTGGVLRAVVYSADALIFSQALTIPTDGAEHLYAIFIEGNFTFWYVDNFSIPLAVSGLTITPANTQLPLYMHSLNGASTTSGSPILNCFSLAIEDSSRNNIQISDNLYPFRKSQINSLNQLAIYLPDTLMTGAATQTATVNNILTASSGSAATSSFNYRSLSVQVISTGTAGTYIFECSNDNVNFVSMIGYNITLQTGVLVSAAITASASNIIYSFPVNANYVRLRIVTTITGGSIQAFSRLSQNAWSNVNQVVSQSATNLLVSLSSPNQTNVTNGTFSLPNPSLVADVASAAITTTTTTAAITPNLGTAYTVNIPVTVATGTTPTMDVEIQESMDTGTNWVPVYDFPRITATGSYNSPTLLLKGNRIRYVQTITGTTPSFTRAINRLQSSVEVPLYRQLIDRTIVLTTGGSSTATLTTDSCRNLQLTVDVAASTTAAALQLQGSDDLGTSWYSIGTTPLTTVANSTVSATYSAITAQQVRATVSTAGTGATLNYVLIRGF